MQKFIILKASAGSGKTFNLARKYLEFAFAETYYFKHILAVTFTNKATTELKNRILKEFFIIASNEKSDHLEYLIDALKWDKEFIRKRAGDILANILQDFSNFHIYTIDGFFQGILKGFFRELGINTQFNIELSQHQVLDKATDALFFELAESNNEQLINWLTHFSESEVEEGNTWNLKSKIKKLGEELFTETYKLHTPVNENIPATLVAIDDLRKTLATENSVFWKAVYQQANVIFQSVEKNGFSMNDFKGKSRSFLSQINKILKEKSGYEYTGTLAKFVDDEDQVAPKGKGGDDIRAFYEGSLNSLLKQLNALFEQDYPKIVRNSLILKNLYSLGVIKYVQGSIKKINAEQNTILISDSNELIQKITSGSDAPFIYEKSGNKFWNYMIDEFQDTSRMQWNNLQPLVDNSLAIGKQNLIVGDVKQSIYRWRNSDWKMLGGDIQEQYGLMAETKNLPANYRSRNNIIAFNNSFFHRARQVLVQEWQTVDASLAKMIETAYEASFQEFGTETSGGFVKAKVIESPNKTEFQEEALKQLTEQIELLLDAGYQQSDLVILVRKNTEGAEIINQVPALMQRHKVNFVSEDSYFLQSSYVVQFILSVLRYLHHQTEFHKSHVLYLYHYYLANEKIENEGNTLENQLNQILSIVSSRSLINLVHEIILCFDLLQNEKQRVFVLSLMDETRSFQNQHQGGLEEFLRFWENSGEKLVIKDARNNEAVRILTIHKSKGLEFKVVLVPFLDWEFDPQSTISPILWCDNPINSSISVLPLRYGKKMESTTFKDVYHNEKVQNVIDSLNLIYVAFTRAVEGLYFGVKKAKFSRGSTAVTNVSKLLETVLTSDHALPNEKYFAALSSGYTVEENEFSFGSIPIVSEDSEDRMESKLKADFVIQPAEKNIKVRRNLKQKVAQFKSGNELPDRLSSARLGTILHSVFEDLDQLDDMPQKFQNLINKGWLNDSTAKLIMDNVLKIINTGLAKEWFGKDVELLNEKEIITEYGEILRPDRVVKSPKRIVVIDYKFGKNRSLQYQAQVKKYMEVLRKIYSQKVEGAVWYVLLGDVVRVNT